MFLEKMVLLRTVHLVCLKTVHFKVPKMFLLWHRCEIYIYISKSVGWCAFRTPLWGACWIYGLRRMAMPALAWVGFAVLLGKISRSGFALHWFHLCLSRSVSLCFTLFLLKWHSMTDHSGTDQTPWTFKTGMLIMRRSRRSRPYDPVEGHYKSVTQF